MSRVVAGEVAVVAILAACASGVCAQDPPLAERERLRLVEPYSPRASQTSQQLLDAARTRRRDTVDVELKRRGTELVVQAQDKPVVIDNAETLSKYVQGLPLNYELAAGDETGTLQLKPVALQVSESWNATGLGQKYDRLDQAFGRLDSAGIALARPDAGEAQVDAFADQLQTTRTELARSYRTAIATADVAEQQALLETYRAVQRTGKAIYGHRRDDRYPPQAYERIYANSKGSVAILESGRAVHCSGVLIGRDLVLTNHHCVEGLFPQDLDVRFDFEVNLLRDPLPSRTFDVAEFPAFSLPRESLDFAVLRIAPDSDGRHPGDIYPAQCMTTARVQRDDPLYLIGHPLGTERTVHDNTFVYFPFRVKDLEFTELEMAVRAEFLGSSDEAERLEEFRASYKRRENAGVVQYVNYSARWGGQPTIGVDSDTFHGNSGSPAFNRKTHLVVGILFDGEEDRDMEWDVGWRAHEAVLPISEIIARLDTNDSSWRSQPGVCIRD